MPSLFSTPKTPALPPPPPPPPQSAAAPDVVGAAAGDARRRAASALGYSGTVLTGPGGVEAPASTTNKNLLGQ